MSGYFLGNAKDLSHVLKEGNRLEIQGEIKITPEGQLEFEVIKIAPGYSRPGKILRSAQETLERLRQVGVPSERLDNDAIYMKTEASPKLDDVPKKILVISAEGSQDRADLVHAMADIQKHENAKVTHIAVAWRSDPELSRFKEILLRAEIEDYDLILIAAAGGRWNWLRHYNRADLAEAIHDCSIKVATAIGHHKTVTMADRAANYAFITPTAAGEAIRKTLGAAHHGRRERQRISKIETSNASIQSSKASGTEAKLRHDLNNALAIASKRRNDA